MSSTAYTFELWTKDGIIVADISALATNRSYTLERNAEETLSFDLDMYEWERFCAAQGLNPRQIITPYQSDIKVLRNGSYLFGTQIAAAPLNIGTDYSQVTGPANANGGSFNPTITVTASGYLNLLKDRYLTSSFTNAERCSVAGTLVTQTQSIPYGNLGITLAAGQYSTGVTDGVRTYTQGNIKTSLQNLAQLSDARFDFAFGYDKQFYTYGQIGSVRTDLQMTFGGPGSNMIGFYEENSATTLFNQILALGSGFGPDQLTSVASDTTSQINNFLRQTLSQHNSDVNQSTLDTNAAADLAQAKSLLNLPQVTISGKELEGIPFLSVGDRIPLNFPVNPYLAPLAGLYRIERFTVTLDDNDFEESIRIYFDNFDLAQ